MPALVLQQIGPSNYSRGILVSEWEVCVWDLHRYMHRRTHQGCNSETRLYIGMDRNLSVYGADTIAEVKLLISPFLCLIS
jgi:hypothetical protein